MLRPQMLEAVFVAGSVFVGMTAPAVKWEQLAAVSQREMTFGYQFISSVEDRLNPFDADLLELLPTSGLMRLQLD